MHFTTYAWNYISEIQVREKGFLLQKGCKSESIFLYNVPDEVEMWPFSPWQQQCLHCPLLLEVPAVYWVWNYHCVSVPSKLLHQVEVWSSANMFHVSHTSSILALSSSVICHKQALIIPATKSRYSNIQYEAQELNSNPISRILNGSESAED